MALWLRNVNARGLISQQRIRKCSRYEVTSRGFEEKEWNLKGLVEMEMGKKN